MTTPPSEGLDLSVLAQVSGESAPVTDAPPILPDGEQPVRQAAPRTGTTPRAGARQPRTGRSSQPRSPGTTPQPRPEPEPRRITRDEDAPPEYRPGILVKPLTDLYVAVGTMMLPISPPVGTAFVQNAKPCAESLDELARTNPQVRKVLMSLLQTGAWGKVIAAHLPILLAIGVTYSPAVRNAMGAAPIAPDTTHDTTDTVNPMSNGYTRDNRPRQP